MKAFRYLIAAACLFAEPVYAGNCAGGCGGTANTATCATCNSGRSGGSLDDFPGGCCNDLTRANCCASLWADYCRDKKPCWSPSSPRRGTPLNSVGCGAGCDFLRHPCLTSNCGRCAKSVPTCASPAACDSGATGNASCDSAGPANSATPNSDYAIPPSPSALDSLPDVAPPNIAPLDNNYEPADVSEPAKQEAAAEAASEQPIPPEPGSASRWHMLPFGLNSPNPKRTFPFESKPTAKRNSFPFSR